MALAFTCALRAEGYSDLAVARVVWPPCVKASISKNSAYCVRRDVRIKLYRNDERNGVDHLQQKGHLEDLLPDVPLK